MTQPPWGCVRLSPARLDPKVPITDQAIVRLFDRLGKKKSSFTLSPMPVILFCHTRISCLGVDIIVPILQRDSGSTCMG